MIVKWHEFMLRTKVDVLADPRTHLWSSLKSTCIHERMPTYSSQIAAIASRPLRNKLSRLALDTTPINPSIKKKYQFLSSFILQRNPLCMTPLTAFEREYEAYQQALQSSFSRGPFDTTPVAVKKTLPEEDRPMTPMHTSTNLHDSTRLPHLKLYLLLLNKYTERWEFPHLPYDGETALMDHVKKSCTVLFGDKVQLIHQGFLPLAHYYEHFQDRMTDPIGAKTFFYKTQWMSGDISLPSEFANYAWLSGEEVREQLDAVKRIKYFEAIEPILGAS